MGEREVAAQRVADQDRRTIEFGEHLVDVIQCGVACVLGGIVGHGGAAVAEKVDRHHRVPVGEQIHAGRPRLGGRAEAVEEHDGFASTSADGVESHVCGPYPGPRAGDECDGSDGAGSRSHGRGRGR